MNAHITPDYSAIKVKQNAAWGSGDYAKVGVTLQICGEELAETLDMKSDSRVLDVAAGNGNATLAFARRWCDVTSTDFVGTLLEGGQARAKVEGFNITFQEADAENLPFRDGEFDAVVSTFGVMFTPNQQKSASELIRTCSSRGKIGLANWTPESFIGQLFKTIGKHVPPPPGVNSPALWGSAEWLEKTFGDHASSIEMTTKNFIFRYRSADHFIEFFRNWYGPVQKAFQALDENGQKSLRNDIAALLDQFNTAKDGSLRVPSEYVEVVISKA